MEKFSLLLIYTYICTRNLKLTNTIFIMTSHLRIYKRFTSICFFLLYLFVGFSSNLSAIEPQPISAQLESENHEKDSHESKGPINISEVAFEHILDNHSWHLWGEGHHSFSIPLPVILIGKHGIVFFLSSEFNHDHEAKTVVAKGGDRFVNFEEKIYFANEISNEHGQYVSLSKSGNKVAVLNDAPLDFSITKNVTQMFLSMLVLLLLFINIAKAYKKQGVTSAPKGKQSFFEPLIVFVRDDIAKGNIGHGYEKFVPYLLTVFFLILINNVFGLIPIGANLTGNIAFTLVLAVFTLIITNINGNKNYWSHIFLPHAPKAIWPILIPIEIVGILTKPFALMIRLFANIAAGHIIVISLIGLIFIFKSWSIAPVSVAFALFIDVLECLVAFLQAYIFTMLTALFIGSAVAGHHEEDSHHENHDKLVTEH